MKRYLILLLFGGHLLWVNTLHVMNLLSYFSKESGSEKVSGEWLMKKHPKDLVKIQLKKDDSLYWRDPKAEVYQIKVLQQSGPDCGRYAFWNMLYLMHIFSSQRGNFNEIYAKMLDQKQFEAFALDLGCDLSKGTSFNSIVDVWKKIKNAEISCMPKCIPETSKDYIAKMVFARYYRNWLDWGIKDVVFSPEFDVTQIEFRDKVKKEIGNIEKGKHGTSLQEWDIEQIASDVSFFASSMNVIGKFTSYLQLFCDKKTTDDLLPFYIGTWIGGYKYSEGAHAVVLLAQKRRGKIEYFFADSNNYPFGDIYDGRAILKTVDLIIAFTQNLEYFYDTVVRYKYYSNMFRYREWPDIVALEKYYDELNEYKLLDNKLYLSTYKPLLCKFINDELVELETYSKMSKNEQFDYQLKNKHFFLKAKPEKFKDLLKKINC